MTSEHIRGSSSRKKQPGSTPAGDVSERPLRIGEAAKLVGVEAYVLRFWESQFPFIRPRQSRSRHRYYTKADVENLKMVRRLLHTEGYTIAGARKLVRQVGLGNIGDAVGHRHEAAAGRKKGEFADPVAPTDSDVSPIAGPNGVHSALREIREDLRALCKLLDTY